MRAKTAFLLSQIVTQSPNPSALLSSLRTASTLPTLIDSLSPSTAVPTGATGEQQAIDRDFRDKGLRFLVNTVERTKGTDGGLSREEKDKVQNVVAEAEQDGEWSHDDVGMAADEWAAFKEELKA